jgi:hypothetical protein
MAVCTSLTTLNEGCARMWLGDPDDPDDPDEQTG